MSVKNSDTPTSVLNTLLNPISEFDLERLKAHAPYISTLIVRAPPTPGIKSYLHLDYTVIINRLKDDTTPISPEETVLFNRIKRNLQRDYFLRQYAPVGFYYHGPRASCVDFFLQDYVFLKGPILPSRETADYDDLHYYEKFMKVFKVLPHGGKVYYAGTAADHSSGTGLDNTEQFLKYDDILASDRALWDARKRGMPVKPISFSAITRKEAQDGTLTDSVLSQKVEQVNQARLRTQHIFEQICTGIQFVNSAPERKQREREREETEKKKEKERKEAEERWRSAGKIVQYEASQFVVVPSGLSQSTVGDVFKSGALAGMPVGEMAACIKLFDRLATRGRDTDDVMESVRDLLSAPTHAIDVRKLWIHTIGNTTHLSEFLSRLQDDGLLTE